ncbi:MAG TPA: lipopolysaccharide biosynthesis protein [Blastocatellia bacterium]|nr:lipopolysaccharide biosynthesis protein [Blastocatellia bacterium]
MDGDLENQLPVRRASRISVLGSRLRLGETGRQAGMLFSAHTGSMFAGLLVSLIQARWMEPSEMGRFAFCLSIIVICGLFFEVGIFSAGSRVLALAKDEEGERQTLGALILMAAAAGAAFAAFVAIAAVPIDLIFDKDVHWLLLAVSAFAFLQPFQWLVEQSCQGLNRIRRLSLFQLGMSWSYLIVLVALALVHRLTAATALIAYLSGVGLSAAWTLASLRPSFQHPARGMRLIVKEVRGYGINVYLARITGAVSARVDNLIIAYFVTDLAPLGLYAIAQKMGSPISTVARAIAITRFRAFSALDRVPARLTRWNAFALLTLATGLAAFGPFVLKVAFPRYADAAPLLLPIALTGLFMGLFQPYNMFLASHGRGAELRNIAIATTVTSLAGLLLAVPRYGVTGAAWAVAGAMALDYALYLYYYFRFRREREGDA